MIAVMLLLAYGGMTTLCLAMNRHYRQVRFGAPDKRFKVVMRLTGSILLLLALMLGIVGWGPAIGPVVWFGVLSVGALALIFLLPYYPRLVVKSSWIATPVATVAAVCLLAL